MHFHNFKNDNLIINSFNLQRIVKLKQSKFWYQQCKGFNICSYKQKLKHEFSIGSRGNREFTFKKNINSIFLDFLGTQTEQSIQKQ